MASMKFKIDLHPTIQDYEYIYTWMKDAFDKKLPNSGLFHNLYKEDFEKSGRAIVYRLDGKAEAFQTYLYDKETKNLTFQILSLNPKFHHQGIGTRFMNDILQHFRKKGCVVAKYWKPTNNGFRLLKNLGAVMKDDPHNPDCDMFLKLIPSRRQNWTAKRRIVMWKNELDQSQKPDFSWSLNFKRDKKPILAYAFYDWYLGLIQDGVCIYKDKVKYFKGIDYPADYLYIKADTFVKQ